MDEELRNKGYLKDFKKPRTIKTTPPTTKEKYANSKSSFRSFVNGKEKRNYR